MNTTKIPQVGDHYALTINQARRDAFLVEVFPAYSLAVYVMPAGGAFLTRIMDDGRLSRPTKQEMGRHTKARLEAALDRNFEREDEAEGMRSGWKKRLKLKEILEDRARIESKLKVFEQPATPSTPCP